MKNLTRRTKMLLGIAGILVVVIVAGVVILDPGATGLFGTSVVSLGPANRLLALNSRMDLDAGSVFPCNWFSSNEAVVSFDDPPGRHEVEEVTVYGQSVGTSTIEARCGLINVNHASTTITVAIPPTVTPSQTNLGVNQRTTFSVGATGTNCTWSIPSDQDDHAYLSNPNAPNVIVQQYTGPSVLVTGFSLGYASIHVSCANGTGSGGVHVQ
jgi:hypothetical protein